MIYTLTLNPAVDLELTVDEFEFDTVGRATTSRMDCGGKGFNVSRMLANLQTPSIAMGFVGGKSGERLEQTLRTLDIETQFVWIDGETRTNVSIVKSDHSRYLKINEPGPEVTESDIESLTAKVRGHAKSGDWWVLSGSLPPGVPESIYADLTRIIEGAGASVMLDTSGETLRLACAAKPTIVKPNLEEARELTRPVCGDQASDVDVARAVLDLGPRQVIISMGKDGVILATAEYIRSVRTPKVNERNPIGAGDSMVGGVIWGLSQGQSLPEALRGGIACGAATASREGTELGSLKQVLELVAQVGQED